MPAKPKPLATTVKPARAITSASNFFRRVVCPGSHAMEAGLPEVETEYSKEGKLLHDLFLTGKRPDTLTTDQKGVLDLADLYAEEHFANVRRQFSIPEDAKFVDEREVPLVLEGAAGNFLMPGHADVIRSWPKYDVRSVTDAKFGYLEVMHAADNWQTGIYAAMRFQAHPSKAIAVCIDQPRNFGPRKSEAVYMAAQMPGMLREIEKHYNAAVADEGRTLVAGEKQCHYCKAKTKCPAYAEKFMAIQVTGDTAVQSLDNDQLVQNYVGIAYANKIKKEVYAEMRYRIEMGGLPGFKLQNSGDQVEVTDSLALFKRFQAYFQPSDGTANPFTALLFDSCRTIEWGRLYDVLRKLMGLSEKKVEEFVKETSEGLVIRTPIAKRIVREKEVKALE